MAPLSANGGGTLAAIPSVDNSFIEPVKVAPGKHNCTQSATQPSGHPLLLEGGEALPCASSAATAPSGSAIATTCTATMLRQTRDRHDLPALAAEMTAVMKPLGPLPDF
jgi:hypothetical protein